MKNKARSKAAVLTLVQPGYLLANCSSRGASRRPLFFSDALNSGGNRAAAQVNDVTSAAVKNHIADLLQRKDGTIIGGESRLYTHTYAHTHTDRHMKRQPPV